MLADPPHNDLDTHIRDIHALNDYFLTAPVEHFDEQEKSVFFCDIHGSAVSLFHFAVGTL